MNTKISAEFDSAYMADRAYAKIKAMGIPSFGVKVTRNQKPPQPGLFITAPYPRQSYSYYNNLSFGLPETTGTSIRMDTTILDSYGDGGGSRDSVRLEMVVDSSKGKAARSVLINTGGRNIRS